MNKEKKSFLQEKPNRHLLTMLILLLFIVTTVHSNEYSDLASSIDQLFSHATKNPLQIDSYYLRNMTEHNALILSQIQMEGMFVDSSDGQLCQNFILTNGSIVFNNAPHTNQWWTTTYSCPDKNFAPQFLHHWMWLTLWFSNKRSYSLDFQIELYNSLVAILYCRDLIQKTFGIL